MRCWRPEDQVAFGEYLALLDYKLDCREELDRQIEALALEPSYRGRRIEQVTSAYERTSP